MRKVEFGNTDPYQKNGLCVKQKKMNLEGLNGGLPSSELDLHESERRNYDLQEL
jgi:hypothetical protein